MGPTRRDAIRLGMAACAAAAASGCAGPLSRYGRKGLPDRIAAPTGPSDPNLRLANRVGFGPTPGQTAEIAAMGRKEFVRKQLQADLPEEPYVTFMLNRMDALVLDSATLRDLPENYVLSQLQQAAILQAVYSPNQLRERMVDLWTNHFNIYARKAEGAYKKPADDLKVVRQHALGRFSDLLAASAKSPAMLVYLDAQENHKGVPNENYARELLELHTLGVDGGYTYQDIKELARCLTGWTVEDRFLRPVGTWRFDPDSHDDGPKNVLGHRIPAGCGEKDVKIVLDILARHPSTARFVARKICRHFLGDEASTWTETLATIYRQSETSDGIGEIKAMLEPLLISDDLIEGPPVLKRPFDFTVSALRILNADTDGGKPIQEHLDKMGQPLYQWPMPDGYPDKTAAWTGSLLGRWNFALALAHDAIPGTSVRLSELSERSGSEEAFGRLFGVATDMPGGGLAQVASARLASPEFQWR